MKHVLSFALLMMSSCFVLLAEEQQKALAEVLEGEIKAGDSIETVSRILKRHDIEVQIIDNSATFDEANAVGQLPKVQEDLLQIVVYEIDLRWSLGVIYQFNYKKELCGYLVDLRLKSMHRGMSIHQLRSALGKEERRKRGDSNGKRDSKKEKE